jgi:hypothetical protein
MKMQAEFGEISKGQCSTLGYQLLGIVTTAGLKLQREREVSRGRKGGYLGSTMKPEPWPLEQDEASSHKPCMQSQESAYSNLTLLRTPTDTPPVIPTAQPLQ